MLKRTLIVPALTVLLLLLLAANPGIASAKNITQTSANMAHTQLIANASCSQTGCDGLDPYDSGCAGGTASYYVAAMAYLPNGVGYVQLWWSNTCQTNWARTVPSACYANAFAQITRLSDNMVKSSINRSCGETHTVQLYSPGTACAYGSVAVSEGILYEKQVCA